MKLIHAIVRRGFKLKYIYFSAKLLFLKLRYGHSLILNSFTLSLERGALLRIENNSTAEFGDFIYIQRNSNLEVYGAARLKIGDRVAINKNCTIVARFSVTIGDDCLIGENVSIYDHDHEFAILGRPIIDQGFRGKGVRIGQRVWIASSVFIGKGVTIGDDVVIGAHSVITKDVPKNSVIFSEVSLKIKHR